MQAASGPPEDGRQAKDRSPTRRCHGIENAGRDGGPGRFGPGRRSIADGRVRLERLLAHRAGRARHVDGAGLGAGLAVRVVRAVMMMVRQPVAVATGQESARRHEGGGDRQESTHHSPPMGNGGAKPRPGGGAPPVGLTSPQASPGGRSGTSRPGSGRWRSRPSGCSSRGHSRGPSRNTRPSNHTRPRGRPPRQESYASSSSWLMDAGGVGAPSEGGARPEYSVEGCSIPDTMSPPLRRPSPLSRRPSQGGVGGRRVDKPGGARGPRAG